MEEVIIEWLFALVFYVWGREKSYSFVEGEWENHVKINSSTFKIQKGNPVGVPYHTDHMVFSNKLTQSKTVPYIYFIFVFWNG